MAEEYMNPAAGALDWDSEITKDDEYELLPAGTYSFKVESLERARFNGSEKMSACNQANLTLILTGSDGKQHKAFDSLFLHSKAEWRLSQFFTSIGQKKKGEPLKMNWNLVPGSTGKLELTVNKYKKKDGSDGENNKVGKYLPPEQKAWTPGQGF